MAIEETKRWKNPCLGSIVTSIGLAVNYKQISKQDAIDTLEAIKPYDELTIDAIEGTINAIKKGMVNQ